MNCSGPGATHHLACDCREAAIRKEVAGLREGLAASEKAREEAERERDRAAQIATKEAVIASSALYRAHAAESRAERLEETLREILRHDSADEPPSHAEIPLDSCPSCIARAALAAEEGK